ncbi:hypothetical protein FK531_05535 [Rhodococcus spelaei]|uniref:Uncharacterized protein n=1 Tax=Rhodococcus spelaei TaxID=2546320 RepID=A0A541BP49_9NOCA|nr:hypothetical protein [Rhodococcus spelaei]TQF74114.1 hypothetical protein FK531_05535 [Rhodococcus spelaei]
MAELLIRALSTDAALLRRIFGFDGPRRAAAVPSRIVVDAHTPNSAPGIGDTARRAGVPFLIDPQTYFLQDFQHPGDKWANLPFGDPKIWTPADALSPARQQDLIRESVNHQIANGATSIIPPYVHLENATGGWIEVQASLWRGTRRYLDDHRVTLPVTAVFAPGWRLLHPVQGPKVLGAAFAALEALRPTEVAVAASKVAAGVKPEDRLMDLVLMIERLSSRYPVIAWQQGLLGEACIAAGAAGYETGIGWREKCDLRVEMTRHREAPTDGGFGRRPVFVPALGRSIPAKTLTALRSHRALWSQVACADPQCCPPAGTAMLGDARAHAIVSRAKAAHELAAMPRAVWRWNRLAEHSDKAKELADKINSVGETSADMARIDTSAVTAIQAVAHQRRQDRRSRKVA